MAPHVVVLFWHTLRQSVGIALLPVRSTWRVVSLPFRFLFSKVISGDWVPSGPWIAVWTLFGFASNVQTYKKLFGLSIQLISDSVRGGSRDGSSAACGLCDSIIGVILKFDENSPEDVDCEELCPFNLGRCVKICSRIVNAISTSSHYPCVAAGLCNELDEDGCTFDWATKGCLPRHVCKLTRAFPPECGPRPGFALWNKYNGKLSQTAGALAAAMKEMPKCGSEGADSIFCVNESHGIGRVCELSGYVLVSVVAVYRSIAAVESPGAGDDRQWLTFWIVHFLLVGVERFSDLLLSHFSLYYEFKLVFLVYLIFFKGAGRFYRVVHRLHKSVRRNQILFRSYRRLRRWALSMLQPAGAGAPAALGQRPRGGAVPVARRKSIFGALSLYKSMSPASFASFQEELGLLRETQERSSEAHAAYERALEVQNAYEEDRAIRELEDLSRASGLQRIVDDARARNRHLRDEKEEPRRPHGGLSDIYHSFQSPEDIRGRYGTDVMEMLLHHWDSKEFLYVDIFLLRAENLPPCDGNIFDAESQTSDPYCVFYLVHPGDEDFDDKVALKRVSERCSESGPLRARSDGSIDSALRAFMGRALHPAVLRGYDRLVDLLDVAWAHASKAYMEARLSGSAVWLLGPYVAGYSRAVSSIKYQTLDPTWNEELELCLEGGEIDDDGTYHNREAAFTTLLVQVWDKDIFDSDDLIGQAKVQLTRCMDGASHTFSLPLHSNRSVVANDQRGSVTFRVRFC